MRSSRAASLGGLFIVSTASSIAFAQTPKRPRTLPGYAYTVRISSTPVAHGSAALPPTMDAQNYVGHAVVAAGRGRVDIVEGDAGGMFAKGDYLLFDSTDVVIVHPATKEFVPVSRDTASASMQQLDALGAKVTLSDEKATLDSLGPSDTVAGAPTRRYRMTIAFNLSVAGGLAPQRIGTETVIDYWTAIIPDMPPNPLLRANGLAGGMDGGALFRTLSARVDSAAARMGKAIALRTRATTRLILAPGAIVETRQESDVSALRRTQVDESLLMLPAGYRAAQTESPTSAGADVGAKWRKPPGR
jgi:hypothetical protein